MDDGYFLSSTEMGKLKRVLNQPFWIGSGGDFEWLHDSRVDFMFDTWELSFGVFSDDGDINVVMFVIDWGERVTKVNVGIQVQMFIEFMIIVVFWDYAFLWNHDSHQNALILL